jgi:hypothetical protein
MAKRNTTPQSILDAPPIPASVYLIKHEYPNRATRRARRDRKPGEPRFFRNFGNGWLRRKESDDA